MRSALILRLVDITLLLLLGLMAAMRISPTHADLPVSRALDHDGVYASEVEIVVTNAGVMTGPNGEVLTERALKRIMESAQRVTILADAQAPATRIMMMHRQARAAKATATFMVLRHNE